MCISAARWRERCRGQIHPLGGVCRCLWWKPAAGGGRSTAKGSTENIKCMFYLQVEVLFDVEPLVKHFCILQTDTSSTKYWNGHLQHINISILFKLYPRQSVPKAQQAHRKLTLMGCSQKDQGKLGIAFKIVKQPGSYFDILPTKVSSQTN